MVGKPLDDIGGNIEEFKRYYEQWKEERRYTDIVSGEDILKYAQSTFPNLVFCENAIQGCRKSVGVSEAGQVYKRCWNYSVLRKIWVISSTRTVWRKQHRNRRLL